MKPPCIYCGLPADSVEHPLPRAFGEFSGAPLLKDRICTRCNNSKLGALDEQFARCGPEGFLRRLYGVSGRSSHEPVNPFYRGSAGGHRIEMKAFDNQLGCDVLMECDAGEYKQVRQLIFIDSDGRSVHLPILEGTTPEQLRAAYKRLELREPVETHILCDDDERQWVDDLLRKTSPAATLSWNPAEGAAIYDGAVATFTMSNSYFRAVAKIGFHYFLTQFPEYAGNEPIFAALRTFIVDDARTVDRANDFIGKRQLPLLAPMFTPGARPAGWQAHLLGAEIKDSVALAHVQMFISEDWPAPAYTVRLGERSLLLDRAGGHLYMYRRDGGRVRLEAYVLETMRTNLVSPLAPVITAE